MSTIADRLKNLYDSMVIANSVTNEFVEALPDCYDAVEAKGGTIPAQPTAANLPQAISSIPQGSSELLQTIEFTATADLVNTQNFFNTIIKPYYDNDTTLLYIAVVENTSGNVWCSRALIYQDDYIEKQVRIPGIHIAYRGSSNPYAERGIGTAYDFHNSVGDKITLYIYKRMLHYIDLSKLP